MKTLSPLSFQRKPFKSSKHSAQLSEVQSFSRRDKGNHRRRIHPHFEVIVIKEKIEGVCRDPNDDMFLAVAVNAQAPYVVTGDKDLLSLRKYKSIVFLR